MLKMCRDGCNFGGGVSLWEMESRNEQSLGRQETDSSADIAIKHHIRLRVSHVRTWSHMSHVYRRVSVVIYQSITRRDENVQLLIFVL